MLISSNLDNRVPRCNQNKGVALSIITCVCEAEAPDVDITSSVKSARTGDFVLYDQRVVGARQDLRPNTSIVQP